MKRRRMWRLRIWFWVSVGLFAMNAALLSTYRGVYAGRFQALEDEITELRNQRTRATQEIAQREERSRRSRPLASGSPTCIEPASPPNGSGSRRSSARSRTLPTARASARCDFLSRGIARAVCLVEKSIVFTVEGDYAQLRRLVDLLEATDTFVTLEPISLSEATPNLRIDLRLSTLFSGSEPTGTDAEAER